MLIDRKLRWAIQACSIVVMIGGTSLSPDAQAAPTEPSPVSLRMDEPYTTAIQAATTDRRFLSPWVASLFDHPTVPNPRKYLGYIVGAPGRVSDVGQIHGYFRELASSSPRAKLFSYGLSDEGREGLVLAVGDEATIAQLDRYQGHLHALADPRRTDAQAAEAIIAQAKPVYWVTAGLHSYELGPPEMTMELAYRLITEEREPFASIRKNVIVLITPILEVDGRARQVDWTRQHALGYTDEFEHPPLSPPYIGNYAHQENNRDSIGSFLKISQNYFNTFFTWLPTLALDLHESIPYLFVASVGGPYNASFDATTITEWQLLANYEITRLNGFGMPGVWTWAYGDGWYPGHLSYVTNTHNASGRFFETFGNYSPETMRRDLSEKTFLGQPATSQQWYRLVPPETSTIWSMRNNTNYMESGVIASLEAVASSSKTFLRNFYDRSAKAVRRGIESAPHAFVIPMRQRDPAAASALLGILRRQRIELGVLQQDESAMAHAGDLLVRLDQPYGPAAKALLEIQRFPGNPTMPPYDDVAWTLGLMLGVTAHAIDDPQALGWRAQPLDARQDPFVVAAPPAAPVVVIAHLAQETLGPLRFALGRSKVYAAEQPFEVAGQQFPAGSVLIPAAKTANAALPGLLEKFKISGMALDEMPQVAMHELDLPRIAVLQSWTFTQGPGWVRFAFDQAHVPYTMIDKDDLHRGHLRRRYDLILVPSFGPRVTAAELIRGIDRKWGRLPYEKTANTPNLGTPQSSPDISGGFGFDGLQALQEFVTEGGTLVTLGSAGVLVAETGISTKIAVDRPPNLNTPGSVITTQITDRTSPLVYGYDAASYVFHGNGPLYRLARYQRDAMVMRFGTAAADGNGRGPAESKSGSATTSLILSGGIISGEELLDGSPAIIRESLGKGQIVVFGWNPMHRYLNHHDHAFLYNALLNWNDLGRASGKP